MSRRAKLYWTLGNLLMLAGAVVLLYVGGVYANAEYGRYAARGDTEAPAPVAVDIPSATGDAEPAPFIAPLLNTSPAGDANREFSAVPESWSAEVTRVVIPSIDVDSKVVEVGWEIEAVNGQETPVWVVAKYAVGQHRGSANPGEGGNIVLAGHVGGYGKVFKDLYYVEPGDSITLYSQGQQYLYTVEERLLVTEEGVSLEQQAKNAELIAPSSNEQVTLVTCWPPSGPKKFSQRVVVRAIPFAPAGEPSLSSWSIR